MKSILFMLFVTVFSFFGSMKVEAAQVSDAEPISGEIVLASAPAKTSLDHVVYVVNSGKFAIQVKILDGEKKKSILVDGEEHKVKNEDLVKPRSVGVYNYTGYQLLTLQLKLKGGDAVQELQKQEFRDGSWLVQFDEKGNFSRTQDLSKLPERKKG